MEEKETKGLYKRRVRYSGTHPKHFNEKYKEHNPQKYKETVEKVIRKGSTPAGMHLPICVNEILDFLAIQEGQQGIDATLGYGGHTSYMLKNLNGKGHIYSMDIDPIEIKKTTARLREMGFSEEVFTPVKKNFAFIEEVARDYGKMDFLLADLGVSSMQIDNPERGFSYKVEGPLDLRLNPMVGESAAERLAKINRYELEAMLVENADEPYATEIAKAIISKRKKGIKIDTTRTLADIIEETMCFVPEKEKKETIKKTCARVFQALRIDVNSEFEVLSQFLESLPNVMASNGRIAILTFHSGEDRLVKKIFKDFQRQGIFKEVAKEVIRPSAEECSINSRAKSTKMRWAIMN